MEEEGWGFLNTAEWWEPLPNPFELIRKWWFITFSTKRLAFAIVFSPVLLFALVELVILGLMGVVALVIYGFFFTIGYPFHWFFKKFAELTK